MANGGKRTVDRVEGLPPEAAIKQLALAMDEILENQRQMQTGMEEMRHEQSQARESSLRQYTALLVLVIVTTLGVISNLVSRLV